MTYMKLPLHDSRIGWKCSQTPIDHPANFIYRSFSTALDRIVRVPRYRIYLVVER